MNDFVWYSRFAVLVGALVLLVQSVTGRAVGFVTLIGILLLCFGFVVFVVALALEGRAQPSAVGVSGEADDRVEVGEDPQNLDVSPPVAGPKESILEPHDAAASAVASGRQGTSGAESNPPVEE